MKDWTVDTRGLAAFGGSRWRKLLWTIASFDRPVVWLLPITVSLVGLAAPDDVLTRLPWLREACERLVQLFPWLRHAPVDSPFPQVIQLATCLGFLLLCAHVPLAIALFAVSPISSTAGIRRLLHMGQSVSMTWLATVIFLVGCIGGYWALVTADTTPGIFVRSFRNSRIQVALLFGFGPMMFALALATCAKLFLYLFRHRGEREE